MDGAVEMSIRGQIIVALAVVGLAWCLVAGDVRAEALQKTEGSAAAAPAAGPQTFKCEGPFARDTSHARLVKEYGTANIDTEVYWNADAEVTTLFPKDPQRRLIFNWKDWKGRRKPAVITIERGQYWSVAGLMIDAPLEEVERLNGGPFKLNYFEGDYGGAITDWMGGRLDAPFSSGCRVGITIAIDEKLPEAVSRAIDAEMTPDRSLLSSGAGLRAAKPRVGGIDVIYPK
jgi:hypothetical protein